MRKKEIISCVLVFLLSVSIFVSINVIVEAANHDCEGENCPICAQLEICFRYLTDGEFEPAVSAMIVIIVVYVLSERYIKEKRMAKQTLVSLKVELLD